MPAFLFRGGGLRACPCRWLPALVPLVLAACSPGGNPYYPVDDSTWWVFDVSSTILDEMRTSRFVARNRGLQRDGRLRQSHQAYRTTALDVTGGAVVRASSVPGAPLHTVLPATPAPGQRWHVLSSLRVIESRTFARQDRIVRRHYPVDIEKSIAAIDATVTTAAGRFDGCLLVVGHGVAWVRTDRGNSSAEVRVETREWYAPGLGPVRVERSETSHSTFLIDGRETWDLLDYGT